MPAEGAKPTGDSGEVENVAALGAEQGDAGNQTTTDGSKAAPDSSKGAAEDEKDSKEEKAEKGEEDTTSKDPFYYGNGSPTTLDDAQTPGTNPTLPPETTTTTGIMDLMTYMPEDNAGDPFVSPGAAHRPGSRHVKAHDGFHSLTTEQYWAHWNDRFTTKKSRNGHHWRDLMQ
ncbi:chloride intracellular channel protein 6 [Drosophila madeirensis]